MSAVDLAPLISAAVNITVPIIVAVIGLVINRYVRNEEMRKALLSGLEYGVQFGMSRVSAATAGKPITVDVAVPVLAEGLNYVLRYTPRAVEWFRDNDEDIVRKLAARLPGLQGALTDEDIAQVVELASAEKSQ